MIEKFRNLEIPLYVAILVLVAAIWGAMVFAQKYLQAPTYNYQFFLPSGPGGEKLAFGSWPALADRNFFDQVKDRFTAEKSDFIEADLTAMRLRVYKTGVQVKEVQILSKGKEGSWWETPAGLYKIETKERNHFSSFGRVYQPWSMAFEGNFFIHGWPYYPDGTPVGAGYSGGCIRLSSEDAEAVYGLVSPGTPVLVYEKGLSSDAFRYQMKIPPIAAQSYLAADLDGNFVFAQNSPDAEMPIASITKLMTALVAVEYVNIEKEITIQPEMIVPTSKPRLAPGQKYSLFNLLHPLLTESSNEAAEAIAGFVGRDRFIDLMNQKSKAVGMAHTRFADPSGRSSENVSTAGDLFTLAKYLLHNRSFILKITAGKVDERTYGPLVWRDLQNFNRVLDDPSFLGGKVGMSDSAGETLVSIFSMDTPAGPRPLAIILLNTPDYTSETAKIYDWIKNNYAPVL